MKSKKVSKEFRDCCIRYWEDQIKILSAKIDDMEWEGADRDFVSPFIERKKKCQNIVSQLMEI